MEESRVPFEATSVMYSEENENLGCHDGDAILDSNTLNNKNDGTWNNDNGHMNPDNEILITNKDIENGGIPLIIRDGIPISNIPNLPTSNIKNDATIPTGIITTTDNIATTDNIVSIKIVPSEGQVPEIGGTSLSIRDEVPNTPDNNNSQNKTYNTSLMSSPEMFLTCPENNNKSIINEKSWKQEMEEINELMSSAENNSKLLNSADDDFDLSNLDLETPNIVDFTTEANDNNSNNSNSSTTTITNQEEEEVHAKDLKEGENNYSGNTFTNAHTHTYLSSDKQPELGFCNKLYNDTLLKIVNYQLKNNPNSNSILPLNDSINTSTICNTKKFFNNRPASPPGIDPEKVDYNENLSSISDLNKNLQKNEEKLEGMYEEASRVDMAHIISDDIPQETQHAPLFDNPLSYKKIPKPIKAGGMKEDNSRVDMTHTLYDDIPLENQPTPLSAKNELNLKINDIQNLKIDKRNDFTK